MIKSKGINVCRRPRLRRTRSWSAPTRIGNSATTRMSHSSDRPKKRYVLWQGHKAKKSFASYQISPFFQQVCEENFEKDCQLTFKQQAYNETVSLSTLFYRLIFQSSYKCFRNCSSSFLQFFLGAQMLPSCGKGMNDRS